MKSRSLMPLLPTVVIAITVTMMLLSPAAGRAAAGSHRSYFVASGGSDAISCAANGSASPFATLQRALACTTDGDVLNLAPNVTPYPGIGAITHNVTVQAQPGANARTVTIDAGKGELSVAPGTNAALTNVELSCPGNDCGASPTVTDEGTLTLSGDQITGNLGLHGAILETTPVNSATPATLQIIASTISENAAINGGAIDALPGNGATGPLTLTIADSTIAGNYAQSAGGAISFNATTPGSGATITNTTITNNTAQKGGGGISATGPVTLNNTILAANTAHVEPTADCQDEGFPPGTHIVDGPAGHNLIGNSNGCPGLATTNNGDQAGASHPGLLSLENNGGPTDTVALQAGSPALGAGDPATCAGSPVGDRDQRGEARKTSTRGCDVGAYDTAGEGGTVDRSFFVASGGSDAISCNANGSASPFATLQRALVCTTDGDVVNLAPSTTPYPGIRAITHNVTVQAQPGANARTVTIDAGKGELAITPGANAALTGIDLSCPANDCAATPTVTDEGTLTLTGDQLTGNLSLYGAILETTPANSATPASLRVIDSTISENASIDGGAIQAVPGTGATGALTLTIANSTIAGNYAQSVGGGISFNATTPGSGATITNTTITNNTAQKGGGGISATGPVTLDNTILAANTAHVRPYPDCQDEGSPTGTHILDGAAGHNLIGNTNGCPGLVTTDSNDQAGTSQGLLDPRLAPLAYNGGATETAPLLTGSPAIHAGAAGVCESRPVAGEDQRGRPRKASARGLCDIGAYDTAGVGPAAGAPMIHARAVVKASESKRLSLKITAKGTPTPLLSETGTLPAGVQLLDNKDGTASLVGTPTAGSTGNYPITLTAINGVGPTVEVPVTITVRR